MNNVLLVGVLHLSGTSKKTGEPYDFYTLQYLDPHHNDDRVCGTVCVNDVACDPEMLLKSGVDLRRLEDEFIPIYVSFDRRGNLINIRVKED